jgi:hypothetical protein
MQVGDYTVDLAATKAGKQYSATATFKMEPLASDIPTWSKVGAKLSGNTFTRNVEYSFSDGDLGIYNDSTDSADTTYSLKNSMVANIVVPGGFKLDADKSADGFTQPGGAGTPIKWSNPSGKASVGATSFAGTFTEAAGTYSTSSASPSYYAGYFGYDDLVSTVSLDQAKWSVNIVDFTEPTVQGAIPASALIGTNANIVSHLAETQFMQSASMGNTDEAEKNVVLQGDPTIDGSSLVSGYVDVYSKVGETVRFEATEASGTKVDKTLVITADKAMFSPNADGSALYEVPLPTTNNGNPYTSVKITISQVDRWGGIGYEQLGSQLQLSSGKFFGGWFSCDGWHGEDIG